MLQRGRQLSLPPEPGHRLRIRLTAQRQHLDRDMAVQPQVTGTPHLAHAAPADPLIETVTPAEFQPYIHPTPPPRSQAESSQESAHSARPTRPLRISPRPP